MYRIYSNSSNPDNILKINKTIGGCACNNLNTIVGWLSNSISKDTLFYYDAITGVKLNSEKFQCQYTKLFPSSRKCILCYATAIRINNKFKYKLISFDGFSKNNFLTNANYNDIVKKEIVELSYLFAIIPDSILISKQ